MKRVLLWVAVAALLGSGVALVASGSASPATTTVPVSREDLEPETAEHTEVTPPEPSPSLSATPSPTAQAVQIAGSKPVKLRFPSIKDKGKVVTVPVAAKCNWVDGSIDPDRSNMESACYAIKQGKPYVLPATDAKDVAVIAGHTMKQLKGDKRQIAFNPLRQWTRDRVMLQVGDTVEVYTKASQKLAASCRLVYQVDKYWEINKGELAGSSKVWGKKPMPNTLLLIACKQRSEGASLENVVWRAQLVDTTGCG